MSGDALLASLRNGVCFVFFGRILKNMAVKGNPVYYSPELPRRLAQSITDLDTYSKLCLISPT
jgi:hypothetical protein